MTGHPAKSHAQQADRIGCQDALRSINGRRDHETASKVECHYFCYIYIRARAYFEWYRLSCNGALLYILAKPTYVSMRNLH